MLRFVACLVVMLAAALPASAETYFVRRKGNDAADGRTAATAFKTIARACDVAQPGDTIYVGGGTHVGPIAPLASGTAEAPIVFIADSSGEMTGDAATVVVRAVGGVTVKLEAVHHVEVRGFRLETGDSSVLITNAEGIRFVGCRFQRPTQTAMTITDARVSISDCLFVRPGHHGVHVSGVSNVSISSSDFNQCGRDAVMIEQSEASEARITRCNFTSGAAAGVAVHSGKAIITASLFKANRGDAVAVAGGEADVRVWNCTLRANTGSGVSAAEGELELVNCILANNKKHGLSASGGSVSHHHNLYHANKLGDYSGASAHPSELRADPRFLKSNNERLAANSPAIDVGVDAEEIAPIDLAGDLRPGGLGFDLGCYETGAAGNLAQIPFFDDFEAGASAFWTSTTSAKLGTLGRFAGYFGRTTAGTESQSIRVLVEPQEHYTLFFDLYLFGKWQGVAASDTDRFSVAVGGDVLFDYACSTRDLAESTIPVAPMSWGVNRGRNSGNDWIYRRIRIDFTADASLAVLTFRGSPALAKSAASWAIDNVRVVPSEIAAAYEPLFRDEAPRLGLASHITASKDTFGSGWHWADFDGDGRLDAILTGSSARFYRNRGNLPFASSSIGDIRQQIAVLDFDHDGDLDFWAIGHEGSKSEVLFRNDGATLGAIEFTNAGHRGMNVAGKNRATAAADVNLDGWADVVVFGHKKTYVGLHPGDPEWALDVHHPPSLGLGAPGGMGNGDYCSSADVNNDGIPDFFYHFGGGRLFLSQGPGRFELASDAGISVATSASAPIGSTWGDFDNDGDVDLFVPSRSKSHAGWLWRNDGGHFASVASSVGITGAFLQTSACWGDFDNNGWLDLFVVGDLRHALYLNDGGRFVLADAGIEDGERRALDCAAIDYDSDGLLDIAISYRAHPPKLLRNQQHHHQHRGLTVRAVGRGGPGFTNAASVGVRVELLDHTGTELIARRDLGGASGFGGTTPLEAHFGVDPEAPCTVRVHFASGPVDVHGVPQDWSSTVSGQQFPRVLTVVEPDRSRLVRGVLRWGEMTHDEQQLARDGVPLDERGPAARAAGGKNLERLIQAFRRAGLADARIRALLGGDPTRPLGGQVNAFTDDDD